MNMEENFKLLNERVLDTLKHTDLVYIRNKLKEINEPTLVSGVGGSGVVADFTSKIISAKNGVITRAVNHRDMNYINHEKYKNIIVCSYGGKNYGVKVAFNNNLNHYLLSKRELDNVTNLTYKMTILNEHSFISLASTLIPMTIMLEYYLEDKNKILEILNTEIENFTFNSDIYEIISGCETSTASKYLESTLVESAIGLPIVHDKYDLCHGRTTLGKNYKSNVILFNNKNNLDLLISSLIKKYYENTVVFERKYEDNIVNDYYFTYISMLLSMQIAKAKNKDLSIVDYSPMVKKLYYFNGGM